VVSTLVTTWKSTPTSSSEVPGRRPAPLGRVVVILGLTTPVCNICVLWLNLSRRVVLWYYRESPFVIVHAACMISARL
jgi:hypothetical protein